MSYDHLPSRELELLSAYLDGELKPRQARKLEARLQVDPRLREELRKLRAVSRSLRALPQVKPPRSFVLAPEMVGASRSAGYPALRLATALAAFAFVSLLGVDLFASTFRSAMPARLVGQVMAEAPAVAESEFADAAKSEVAELEAMEEVPAEGMIAAAEAPLEEDGELLGLAEPAAEQEGAAVEERAVGEAEAPAEPQPALPEVEAPAEPLAVPEMTVEVGDETMPTYSATSEPEEDAMANQVEPPEPLDVDSFAQPARRSIPPINWLRVVEAGLALLTLVLAGLTLRARKRSA